MSQPLVYAALDIEENKTMLILATALDQKMHICARYIEDTKGVRDGEIYSKTDLQATITTLLDNAKKDNFSVNSVILTLPSNKMNVYHKTADKTLPTRRIIEKPDIVEINRAVASYHVLEHEMIIGVYPIRYTVDKDEEYSSEPVGAKGTRISLDALLLAAPIAIARGYVDLLQDLDIMVIDVVPSPIANAYLLLKSQEFKNGALILDLNYELSSISTYADYLMWSYKEVKYGVNKIVDDLAKTYGFDNKRARQVYERYGCALVSEASDIGLVKSPISDQDIKEISIVETIDNSLNKILSAINEDLRSIINDKANDLPLIITGPMANLPGIERKVSQFLGFNAVIRTLPKVGGTNPIYNAAIGSLVRYFTKIKAINIKLIQI